MDNLDSRLARVRSIRGSSCAAARPGSLASTNATAGGEIPRRCRAGSYLTLAMTRNIKYDSNAAARV